MHFRDSRYNQHDALVFQVIQRCNMLYLTITGYLAENYELAEDFYGGEAD